MTSKWKAGKYMALTNRTTSVNLYIYSKLLYKTAVIDIKKGDTEKITSLSKSFIYQDMFLKPEEIVLF